MNELQLLVDLCRSLPRQAPGGGQENRRAIQLAGLDRSRPLRIADIGCGTGASAITLATELGASVVAVDLMPDFLGELETRARASHVSGSITTLRASMDSLPFADREFDAIWSEGAVYHVGFETGVSSWRRFRKPGGKLVLSEITWLSADRPPELTAYWEQMYPGIASVSSNIGVLERQGYRPDAFFVLSPRCWLENYYHPLRDSFDAFLERHGGSEPARAVVDEMSGEAALYERFGGYYGYGVFIATRLDR